MSPKKRENSEDFFKVELEKLINKRRPLAQLSEAIKWEDL